MTITNIRDRINLILDNYKNDAEMQKVFAADIATISITGDLMEVKTL